MDLQPGQKFDVIVKRKSAPSEASHEQTFEVAWQPGMNVISVLMEIRRNAVTKSGEKTTPVAWEAACLEEVCGSCTMVINGKVRQACSAIIARLELPLRLEPMSKFPTVRDLVVDRNRFFEDLKKVKAWIPIDGTYDLGEGPRMTEAMRKLSYKLSECMTCGCCLEACPQYTPNNNFVGAAVISQARLFNSHPTGAMNKHERIEPLAGPGGLSDCGNAQNCVEVCPKHIPLTESIAEMNKQALQWTVKKLFTGHDV